MKIWSIATLLASMALAIACGGDGSIEGKFVRQGHPEDYLQLRSDGSFFQEEAGQPRQGSFP